MDKKAEFSFNRGDISKALDNTVRKIAPNPLVAGLGLGAIGAGVGYGLWKNIVDTGGSLGRWPIKKMTGMTDDEYDQAMDEFKQDKRYRWILPTALGGILGGAYLYGHYDKGLQGKGLLSWAPKTASLHKEADELFSYGGYVPQLDFSQVINARAARDMFSNDPNLQNDPYVKNTGIAIINDAANRAGYINPTLGNIYDSAADKIKRS